MITYGLVLILLYTVSGWILQGSRLILNVMATITGMLLILNDWNNTIIPDDTLKLTFALSFLLYGLIVFVDIHKSKGE